MVKLGVIVTAATITVLTAEFVSRRKRPLPAYGWMGLAALLSAEWLMFRGVEPVATYFTPIAWTAYILIADAALFAMRGRSFLRGAPRELGRMALLSIPLWLIFEAYNLRLVNWTYVGLPANPLARWLGYAWSFATITPAILLTAELVESFGWFSRPRRPVQFSPAAERGMVVSVFFFNDTATTEIYTLSLHDALPILAATFTAQITPRPARMPQPIRSG